VNGPLVLRCAGVALGAALGAALCAHVAIDVAGDYVLAHDSYDDVAHGSRGVAALVFLALLLAGCAGAVHAALRRARGSERKLRAALRAFRAPNALGFALSVVALTFPLLAGMEALDTVLAGGDLDDLGDLFGGSLALGGGLTVVCGLACAWLARWAIERLAGICRAVVAVVAFLCRAVSRPAVPAARRVRRRARRVVRDAARRLAGRAPPPLLLATTA
jgi:protein-S-isoprenylcysteine O-methyltransferase Ste14